MIVVIRPSVYDVVTDTDTLFVDYPINGYFQISTEDAPYNTWLNFITKDNQIYPLCCNEDPNILYESYMMPLVQAYVKGETIFYL